MAEEKLYTSQELADKLGVSRSTIYRFLKSNSLSPAKINGRVKLYSHDTLKMAQQTLLLPSTLKKQSLADAKQFDQLQKQLELINEQLREKDRQIAELHQLIDHQQKLTLTANKQLQDLLALQEADPEAIKNAAEQVKKLPDTTQAQHILYPTQGVSYNTTNAISASDQKTKKRGFFARLFRRN